MAWTTQSVAQPGMYIYARTVAGFQIDLFGAISDLEMVERLRGYVTGADVIQVRFSRDFLTGNIDVFLRAVAPVNTELLAREIESAINSFFSIAGARVNVYVSDTLSDPLPAAPGTETGSTIRWVAAAAMVVAAALVISQFRR